MRDSDRGMLPVFDPDTRDLLGSLTDRGTFLAAYHSDVSLAAIPVGAVMGWKAIAVYESTDAWAILQWSGVFRRGRHVGGLVCRTPTDLQRRDCLITTEVLIPRAERGVRSGDHFCVLRERSVNCRDRGRWELGWTGGGPAAVIQWMGVSA